MPNTFDHSQLNQSQHNGNQSSSTNPTQYVTNATYSNHINPIFQPNLNSEFADLMIRLDQNAPTQPISQGQLSRETPIVPPSTPIDITARLLESQEKQNKALIQLLEQQQRSVSALTLPNPALRPYSGDPAEYCEFIHAFKHLVVEKAGNDSTKLHYLIQYTKGDAQELMRSCLIMKDGYNRAMSLLEERYGRPYIIATAHVKRLVDGPVVKAEDEEGLRKLSINLMSCVNTLQELGCLAKLEAPDNLRKIIERLPYRLRSSWRDKVDRIIQKEERDVNIKDISEFVTAKARATTHPVFGVIATSNVTDKTRKSVNYAVEVDAVKRNCYLCSGTHWLSRCDKFRQQTDTTPDTTPPTTKIDTPIAKPDEAKGVNLAAECNGPKVSLAAVPVKVRAKGGDRFVHTYAFLDTGSNTTFCTDSLLNQLGAKCSDAKLSLTTMNGANSTINCKVAALEVFDLDGNNSTDLPKVYSRPSLPMTKTTLASQADVNRWKHLDGVTLRHLDAVGIGLLIGSNIPQILQPLEVRACDGDGPYATRTKMGWVINGPIKNLPKVETIANFIELQELSLDDQCSRVEFGGISKARTEMSTTDQRRHIDTKQNPQTIVENSLNIDDPEIKAVVAASINTTFNENHVDSMMLKFSISERLRKTVAWILRYKTTLKKKARPSRVVNSQYYV